MDKLSAGPLGRASLDAATLFARHPPRPRHANKRAVLEIAAPPGAIHRGTVTVSRWPQRAPGRDDAWRASPTAVELREDVFTYDPPPPGCVEWHLNFAHTILFVAYPGPLFAQDEMQVAEHPALASVREWLTTVSIPGLRPVTREDNAATPVLIRGVERRCVVATDPDLDADRPAGLYGNAFARARVTAVQRPAGAGRSWRCTSSPSCAPGRQPVQRAPGPVALRRRRGRHARDRGRREARARRGRGALLRRLNAR